MWYEGTIDEVIGGTEHLMRAGMTWCRIDGWRSDAIVDDMKRKTLRFYLLLWRRWCWWYRCLMYDTVVGVWCRVLWWWNISAEGVWWSTMRFGVVVHLFIVVGNLMFDVILFQWVRLPHCLMLPNWRNCLMEYWWFFVTVFVVVYWRWCLCLFRAVLITHSEHYDCSYWSAVLFYGSAFLIACCLIYILLLLPYILLLLLREASTLFFFVRGTVVALFIILIVLCDIIFSSGVAVLLFVLLMFCR